MNPVLSQAYKRMRELVTRAGIPAFLAWWGRELLGCLPKRWRERLVQVPAELLLVPQADGLWLGRVRGSAVEESVQLDGAAEASAVHQALRRLAREQTDPLPPVVALLPERRVLRRRLSFPAAAEENLRQVLAFEMDRQTPFRPEQVQYDYRIVGRDPASRQIGIELAVVAKEWLESELQRLAHLGVQPDVLDTLAAGVEQPRRAGFNLLPPERRPRRRNPQLLWAAALGCTAIVLTAIAMQQSLVVRRQALEDLRRLTQATAERAKAAAQVEAELRDKIAGANFLVERKCTQPVALEVLLEVTRLLPDDTWLERLSFVGKELQLQGQSSQANKLISVLQNAQTLTAPQFQGIIQPDVQTNKERFNLKADLVARGRCRGPDTATAAR